MTQNLEKAKNIFSKTFCFMEWQKKEATEKGNETMNKDDILFLLSLPGIAKGKLLTGFEIQQDGLDSWELSKIIQKAETEKKQGVILGATISDADKNYLRKKSYFISMKGHGSVFWDEVYFSEEAFLKSEISNFKNLFGSFSSVAHLV